MKMICPQCGVKGSAPSSQLGKKVKCPKCTSIFTISPEVVQPIPMEEIELEELHESVDTDLGLSSEEEIGDVFSKLLGGEEEPSAPQQNEAADFYEEPASDEELIAALSEEDVQPVTEEQWDDDDDTLTVIEEIPQEDEPVPATEVVEEEDDRITLDDMDEEIETVEAEAEESWASEDRITLDEVDEEPEGEEFQEAELLAAEEEKELLPPVEEEYLELDEQTAAEEIEDSGEVEEDELFVDEREVDEDADESEAEVTEAEEIDDEETAGEDEDESEIPIHKCAACGEYVDPEDKHEFDGNVYCSKCVPSELKQEMEKAAAPAMADARKASEIDVEPGRFTISTLIKDAWHYSKGVKGSIWAGFIVMYLLLIGAGVAIALATPFLASQSNPAQTVAIQVGLQAVVSFLSYVLTAGIILIAVNKIGQKDYSWKMVFSGFRRFGAMIGLFLLQTIMLIIGFALFILPGIYLSVGYILAVPLLFEKRLSPWQALETSRKAVHKRWWTVFFSFIVMVILVSISAIPLGIGLIWTIPMFVVLVGVLYYHFFGADE